MKYSLYKILPFLLAVLFIQNTLLIAGDNKLKIKAFPHEVEKIKPHPKAYFGTLKNGFKFILLKNKKPEKRVLVNLVIETGSLNEQEHERGIAHFLEHMAFNGSENFPDNKLIDYFKKIGMSFGGDTNASTTFDKTIYKLNLPSEEHMDAGLLIMSDYSSKLLLNKKNIDDERGIILSEKRTRDTPGFRLFEKDMQFSLPNSLLTTRMPIGLIETIKSVKRKDFVNYYNTWYRPEKMTLIVVGDINLKKWRKSVKKTFKKLVARAPAKEDVILKSITHKGNKINYIFDKATVPDIQISTFRIKPIERRPYYVRMQNRLRESAAVSIINQRLKEISNEGDSPFSKASLSIVSWLNQVEIGRITADSTSENWNKALTRIEQELRRVLTYGFTDQELKLFKKGYLSRLDQAVSQMSTKSSHAHIHKIIMTLGMDAPFLDASQIRAIQGPLIKDITKEDALKALSKYWAHDHRLITVTGNVKIEDPKNTILKTYLKSNAEVLARFVEKKVSTFPYEKPPEDKGKVLSKKTFKKLGIKRYHFENNVILNIKKTDFNKDYIGIFIKLGQGGLTVPKGKEVMVRIGHEYVNEGGIKRLPKLDLNKALIGKRVSVSFGIGPNSFNFVGSANNNELELCFQLLAAKLNTPAFRKETKALIDKKWDDRIEKLNSDMPLKFRDELRKLATITENNYHLDIYPTKKELKAITLIDIKKWLTTQFKTASIEINVVGDFKEKEIIRLTSTYFGGLSKRAPNELPIKQTIAFEKNFSETKEFQTEIEKALIALVIPTTEYEKIEDLRKLNLLGYAINERLRKRIREELSISYSPSARHSFKPNFKNYCYLSFTADVDLKNIDLAVKEFKKIFSEITTKPITKAELEAVQKPLLNQILPYIKSNGYWLQQVLAGSSFNNSNLENAKTLLKSYTNISVDDVNEMAKKYMIKENINILIMKSKK